MKVFGAKHCALFLYDPTTQELRVRGAYGLSDEYVQAVRVRLGESISGMVMLTGQPMSSSDLRRDHRKALPQLVRCEGMVSQLSTPLLSRGKGIGVVNVYSKQKHIYSANEITLLSTLANQIALTLENALLAQYPLHAGCMEEIVKKADEALYKGKFTGRNKVEVYYSILDQLNGKLNPAEKQNLGEIKTMISVISAKDKYTRVIPGA